MQGEHDDVVPGVYEIDILLEDMLRYTNAGSDVVTAKFLIDMAAAAGALYVWVFYNEYFKTKEPKVLEILYLHHIEKG